MYSLRCAALPIAGIAILNSIFLIVAHGRENKHPMLRVYTMRILLLVVVDSIASVCGLWATGWSPVLDFFVENILHLVLELYESVVIFSFLQFVLVCSGGPERLAAKFARRADSVRALHDQGNAGKETRATPGADSPGTGASEADRGDMDAASFVVMDLPSEAVHASGHELRQLHHVPGLGRLLPAWRSGQQMLRWCVTGTLSYVVVGATLALLGLLLVICPGFEIHKQAAWKVGKIFLSAAQAIAIASLAELAVNVKQEISLMRPYGKFLSVKFVVFFSFWQGLLLNGLLHMGCFDAFESTKTNCGAKCAVTVIQNTLVCVEMLAASIFHFYVFPPHDYLKLLAQNRWHYGEESPGSLGSPPTFAEVVDIRDIFRTTRQIHLCRSQRTVDIESGVSPNSSSSTVASHAQGTMCSSSETPASSPKQEGAACPDHTDADRCPHLLGQSPLLLEQSGQKCKVTMVAPSGGVADS